MSRDFKTQVAVIGGGAAGLMAAIAAAGQGAETAVIEQGAAPLRKLRITGKGRCNLTNDCTPEEALLNVTRNARFLNSAFRAFPPADAMAFFEGLGVPLKTERGNRVFPVSDRASDVAEALLRRAAELEVRFIKARAEAVGAEGGGAAFVDCGATRVYCRACVLATGGLSYPKTGSDGSGYGIARRLGHTVTELRPSLAPLVAPDPDCAAMRGLSLKNVELTLRDKQGKALFRELGELQFTHFGLSGPLVLSASAHMGRGGGVFMAEIDLKPGLDPEKLDARILRDFSGNLNRDFKNSLAGLLPRLLIPVVVRRSGIAPETKVNSVTREQRRRLAALLKAFTVEITGMRPVEEAVVTSGGIEIKEIRPATMGSKLVEGLFFAGEIIDVDAYTGGFNLQIAWSTGRAAGLAAADFAARAGTPAPEGEEA